MMRPRNSARNVALSWNTSTPRLSKPMTENWNGLITMNAKTVTGGSNSATSTGFFGKCHDWRVYRVAQRRMCRCRQRACAADDEQVSWDIQLKNNLTWSRLQLFKRRTSMPERRSVLLSSFLELSALFFIDGGCSHLTNLYMAFPRIGSGCKSLL